MSAEKIMFDEACTAANAAVVKAVADGRERDYCGFGWVVIKPARGKFVSFLKANGVGTNEHGGGWRVPRHAMAKYNGQSMGVNEAAAEAFADTLCDYGVKAYARSRID
jgi:hypothetical protein